MSEHKLGAGGRFPRGKLNPQDEGDLTFAVSREGGNVRIDFGKKIAWIAMEPDLALQFAAVLVKHAMALKDKQ